jgi:diguanylate cyclase (GGDEF)-like protein
MTAYFCFLYAEYRMGSPYVDRRYFPHVAALPIVIAAVLFATTGFTQLAFTIEADGSFVEGPLYLVPGILFLGYLAYVNVHALIKLSRETSRVRRSEYATLFLFILLPALCAVIDIVVHGMPIMALATFAAILLLFMVKQDTRINTDALTGLNNRRRAEEYLESTLASLPDSARFAVFIIDADFFKEINDKQGHGEGDHALQLIAQGLRTVMEGHHGLAARWGGDEFLLATHIGTSETPDGMKDAIARHIAEASEQAGIRYLLSVSVGGTLARRGEALTEVIDLADTDLYLQKRDHHRDLQQQLQ